LRRFLFGMLTQKSRAQLASPQLRPTSPVNWGRGDNRLR
jgi:hypothetical protein